MNTRPAQGRNSAASWVPAYVRLAEQDGLEERIRAAEQLARTCRLCPRQCGVDRLNDERGYCLIGRQARVSSAFPHHGEEDCLRGWRGSGTIFFTGCNLQCVFCQNYEISHTAGGKAVDPADLATLMVRLAHLGCHNINLVTPTHVTWQIIEALPPP